MALGDYIRVEREKHRWNRTQLARRAGVSISSVSRIEAGDEVGHFDTMVKIAKALNLDIVTLVEVFLGKPLDRTVYPVDLSRVAEAYRPLAEQAIDGVVAPFRQFRCGEFDSPADAEVSQDIERATREAQDEAERRFSTVKDGQSGDPPPDRQRLGEMGLPHKAPSYMAVA